MDKTSRTKWTYFLGVISGLCIAVAGNAFIPAGRADDAAPPVTHLEVVGNSGGIQMHTGVVADGEQVAVPPDVDTGAVQIFLSIREIQDNNEILGRVECFLEPDGMTARIRNVNKFTGEVVATGSANYMLFFTK